MGCKVLCIEAFQAHVNYIRLSQQLNDFAHMHVRKGCAALHRGRLCPAGRILTFLRVQVLNAALGKSPGHMVFGLSSAFDGHNAGGVTPVKTIDELASSLFWNEEVREGRMGRSVQPSSARVPVLKALPSLRRSPWL